MEMIYSALLLHSAKQSVDEANLTKVLQAAGITPDTGKVKAVVAALDGVNIEEAISKAAMPVASAAPADAGAAKKEESTEEDDSKKAEQAVEGLAGLFG
ncbi:MAG: 50S ribosomal protein P1 [Candidatus Aenigmarchaeota archaeon]|nr:50S ribosomal protein P1 [Candidatus Aenigmarchaeota archaeon]